ncbi:hypothetical protein GOP47_0008152 [Adiantum capillus-veneris]|uniref:Uncharacterized protein n=1 Tax=Adiantum capillus-veneris TaxID=13818 RepID=A0A9D4ZJE5_ADICA|nr:hypothetical protein GOP47_0008152 [Adiantum capillus-veneris]
MAALPCCSPFLALLTTSLLANGAPGSPPSSFLQPRFAALQAPEGSPLQSCFRPAPYTSYDASLEHSPALPQSISPPLAATPSMSSHGDLELLADCSPLLLLRAGCPWL